MKADVKKTQELMNQTMTTEKDIVNETGISAAEIKNALAGKTVSAETMVQIANVIGVSVEKIIAPVPEKCFHLYFCGKPYSSEKYTDVEAANAACDAANACFSARFGRVYVCNRMGQQVA